VEGRRGSKDFALVARVLNSKTGQFLVIISGVGMVGTKAAGRFISREDDLETALSATPAGWERKNVEIVLETDIVDGSPSPPVPSPSKSGDGMPLIGAKLLPACTVFISIR